jgi:toxin ParE1/3/4
MKVRLTSQATQDLVAIGDYLREKNPAAALRVRETVQNLAVFPYMGRRQMLEGVRKIVTRRYRYLVYYTVDASADEVIVLSIQHPARARAHQDL